MSIESLKNEICVTCGDTFITYSRDIDPQCYDCRIPVYLQKQEYDAYS